MKNLFLGLHVLVRFEPACSTRETSLGIWDMIRPQRYYINKDTDQTVQVRRLINIFVVFTWQRQVLSGHGSFSAWHCYCYTILWTRLRNNVTYKIICTYSEDAVQPAQMQSDQSAQCMHEEAWDPWLSIYSYSVKSTLWSAWMQSDLKHHEAQILCCRFCWALVQLCTYIA